MALADADNGDAHPAWWADPNEVVAFARVLVESEQLGDCQHAVIDYFAAPWMWNRQHDLWCQMGRPGLAADGYFDSLVGFLA